MLRGEQIALIQKKNSKEVQWEPKILSFRFDEIESIINKFIARNAQLMNHKSISDKMLSKV